VHKGSDGGRALAILARRRPGESGLPRRLARPAIVVVGIAALALVLCPQLAMAQADADDHASRGEWMYLAILSVETAILLLVFTVFRHRHENPHTGLPSRIKRRRPRKPQ